MSILTTLAEDGFMAVLKLIPSYYLIGAGVLALGGLLVWGKIWFHNKVEAEAQVIVNKYVAEQKKDAAELAEVTTKNNTKIVIQYKDRVQVITKTVTNNVPVIVKGVPDTNVVLSSGWVNAYNDIVRGIAVDPKTDSDKTPSGVTAVDALVVDNANYGACLIYKTTAESWQKWYVEQQAAVAAQNKKDK